MVATPGYGGVVGLTELESVISCGVAWSPNGVLRPNGGVLIAWPRSPQTWLCYGTSNMANPIAPKHEPVAVVIRFSKADLYRLMLRQYFKFPIVLGFLFPV